MELITELEAKLDSLVILIESCKSGSITLLTQYCSLSVKVGNDELLKILIREREVTLTQLAFILEKENKKLLSYREKQLLLLNCGKDKQFNLFKGDDYEDHIDLSLKKQGI